MRLISNLYYFLPQANQRLADFGISHFVNCAISRAPFPRKSRRQHKENGQYTRGVKPCEYTYLDERTENVKVASGRHPSTITKVSPI
jgi:hypothetical protein